MKDRTLKIFGLILMLITPFAANANLIWPSLIIVYTYYVWYVILLGLIIEFFATKYFLKASWRKSAIMTVVFNLISGLLGLVLIPISGIIVEILMLPISPSTFHLSHWIISYIVAVFINAAIETGVLNKIYKYPFKKNFWWVFAANMLSVIICILANVIWPVNW